MAETYRKHRKRLAQWQETGFAPEEQGNQP
jgi:hypothetical protein